MTKLEENPYLSFYGNHHISPVHQDLSDFSLHLERREKLYRQLGIPLLTFSKSRLLEVGPGGGYNTLAFFYWGAQVDLVEPNPRGQEEIPKLFKAYKFADKSWTLHKTPIEKFNAKKKYDIVVAEGFIPGLVDRKPVLEKLSSLITKGGILVVSCFDEISVLLEMVRRGVAIKLVSDQKISNFSEKVAFLAKAFKPHLQSLKWASRPVEDWVMDQFFNPALHYPTFSMGDCLLELKEEFDFLGSSPALFSDLSWYKDISTPDKHDLLDQFLLKRHILLSLTMEEGVREIKKNEKLLLQAKKHWKSVREYEKNSSSERLEMMIVTLRDLLKETRAIDLTSSEAIEEALELLQERKLSAKKVQNAKKLGAAFGRGQQYISLVKR